MRTPAVLAGVVVGLLLLVAVVQRPPARLAGWRRRVATWPGGLRRRPRRAVALTAAASLLVGLGVYGLVTRQLMPASCTPSVPAGIVDPPDARMGYQARVFISRQATDDERNLAQAAIGRGLGGGMVFAGNLNAPGFSAPYCAHGRLDAEVAEALPGHWTVDLASPGLFGGLAAEMMAMPGVVAVQHVD
jgi:hypothetical protein